MWINHPSTSDGWNPHPRGVPTKVRGGVAPTIVSCLQVRLWTEGALAHWRKSVARPQGCAALKTVEGPPAPPLLKVRSRCSTKNLKN